MINQLEYDVTTGGINRRLRAHKDVKERNEWHLSRVSGNGLPPVTALGSASYGVAGKSYQGIAVEGREIEAEIYASGYSAAGLQEMLAEANRIVSVQDGGLGFLHLTNTAGDVFRIAAKCIEFEEEKRWSSTSLFSAVFDCPYTFFEDDSPTIVPLISVVGGKEYPLDRPYTFGNYQSSVQPGSSITASAINNGDVSAPCLIKINGSGLTGVKIENLTTGKTVEFVNSTGVAGIEINTDVNDTYARTIGTGADAMRHMLLPHSLSEFVLAPGANSLKVTATGTFVTPSSTVVELRGRYTTCL